MTVLIPMPDFAAMTAADLNDWYEFAVGYRPQVDNPTMSDDDLRALCRSYHEAEREFAETMPADPLADRFDHAHDLRKHEG